MKTLLVLLTLIPALASAANLPSKATITVRPESEVAGSIAVLGDIALVQTQDRDLAIKLKKMELCPSPSPSRSRIVTKNDIIIALRRIGENDRSISILSPNQVSITRSFNRVTGQQLFDVARTYALAAASWPGTVEVESNNLSLDQEIPSGKLEIRVKDGIQKVRKGHNTLPVDILVDGRTYRTIYASITVRVIAPVLVASQTILRSTPLNESNTTTRQIDITNLNDDLIIGTMPVGCSASIQIADGAVIRRSWAAEPSAIHSGDIVLVVAQSGLVRISDKGTAVQDGRVGQTIKVKLTNGSRDVLGTVTEPGLVTISN